MSLQNLAHHLQSAGRGDDKMLVHMTPHEVAGLQSLAAAHGGSLTVNPETGLPEAGFLSSMLPTIIGAALAPATGGASLGLTQAWQTAALVGGAYGLATGSLKKGLMAGLGAYGGANLGTGLMGAGAGASAAAAPAATNTAFAPGQAFNQAGTASLAMPAATNAGFAQGFAPGQAFNQAGTIQGVGAGAGATGNSAFVPGQAFNQAGNIQQAAAANVVASGGTQGAPSVLNQMGGGLQNLIKDPEKLKEFLGDQKYNLLSSVMSSGTEYGDEEKPKTASGIPLDAYSSTLSYAPSPRIAGSTAERTYFAADGGLTSLGPVESMSQQNAMMDNSRFPMAFQNTSTYASPAERPVSQNVIYPATDASVTPYSGTQYMAAGGIATLAKGGQTESQKEIANRKKEYDQWVKERQADIKKVTTDFDNRAKELNNEYKQRNASFNKDTASELKARQAAIKAEKDKAAQKQMQAELAAWQKGRSVELAGLNNELKNALADVTKQKTEDIKNRNTEISNFQKEYNATVNYLKSYDANKYTGYEGGIKGADKTSINKAYDTEIGKQKSEMDKAKAALELAKKTGIQSVISRAQEEYDRQAGDYNAVTEGKKAGLEEFMQSTKRTGELGTRGQYTTKLGDVDAIKKEIADIKKNPAQSGGYGSTSLSAEQQSRVKDLESKLTGMSAAEKVYNPKTGQYETQEGEKFQKLTKAPTLGTAKKIMEEEDVINMYEYMAGRRPTESELAKFVGKSLSETDLAKNVGAIAELGAAAKFTDDDLNAQAQYYWGRPMTKGELAWYKDPANKVTNFNQLRTAMTNSAAFLDNVNKINQTAFQKQQTAAQIAAEGPANVDQISSAYQDILGKPPTQEQLAAARATGATYSQLVTQLKNSPEYTQKATQSFVPPVTPMATQTPAVAPISQAQIDAYRQAYNAPVAKTEQGLASLFQPPAGGAGGYAYTPIGQQAAIEGALPYQDVINRLGIGGVYSQLSTKLPEMQPGLRFDVPTAYTPLGTPPAQGMAAGGNTGGEYHLGDYSDGGRLLKGPGDGVSDSIPASINGRRPARLADGEFVIPARIVSEIGNGSTEAGARQLYAMMDRVQKRRSKSMGKDKVAVDSKASQVLPV